MSLFRPATKHESRLRLALVGPSGSGKTYTALRIATALGQRIAVIDTERRSASKYAGARFKFDTLELTSFAPERYIEGIKGAGDAGYDVLIIDSLSHAWSGKDGILEFVDNVAKRQRSGNTFGAWREATPVHNSLVDAILDARCHVIVTMRAKTEYVQEKDERTGKTTVRKIGMQPVQRDGLEYEMDVVADLDWENNFVVSKTRCEALTGFVTKRAGEDVAEMLREWLSDGAPAPEPVAPVEAPQASAPASAPAADRALLAGIGKRFTQLGLDRDQSLAFARHLTNRELETAASLTPAEAERIAGMSDDELATALDAMVNGGPPEDEDGPDVSDLGPLPSTTGDAVQKPKRGAQGKLLDATA